MKKIIVIGCPGSGKSTFSKELNSVTGIPLCHLDLLYWNADKTVVETGVFKEKMKDILSKETWIVDGNYGSTLEVRLQSCDTVFFLDYPVEVCLQGIKSRKGKPRTDMPWFESENEVDEEFMTFIKNYNHVNRPIIVDLLTKYKDKNIIIFKSRNDSKEYISKL